jgi:hypothetical protein
MRPKSAFTYRDYEALPNDRRRYEIHNGELCVTPAPSLERQIVQSHLLRVLFRHIPDVAPGLILSAPTDVILADRPDETRPRGARAAARRSTSSTCRASRRPR